MNDGKKIRLSTEIPFNYVDILTRSRDCNPSGSSEINANSNTTHCMSQSLSELSLDGCYIEGARDATNSNEYLFYTYDADKILFRDCTLNGIADAGYVYSGSTIRIMGFVDCDVIDLANYPAGETWGDMPISGDAGSATMNYDEVRVYDEQCKAS